MRSLFSPAKLEPSMISKRPCSRLILRPSQQVSHHPASRTGERFSGQSSCRSVDKCRRPRGVIVVVQRACEGLLLSRLLRLEVVPLCVILRNVGSCQQLVRRMMSLGISQEIQIIRQYMVHECCNETPSSNSVVAQSEERWAHMRVSHFGHPEVTGSRPVDATSFALLFVSSPLHACLALASSSFVILSLIDFFHCF